MRHVETTLLVVVVTYHRITSMTRKNGPQLLLNCGLELRKVWSQSRSRRQQVSSVECGLDSTSLYTSLHTRHGYDFDSTLSSTLIHTPAAGDHFVGVQLLRLVGGGRKLTNSQFDTDIGDWISHLRSSQPEYDSHWDSKKSLIQNRINLRWISIN